MNQCCYIFICSFVAIILLLFLLLLVSCFTHRRFSSSHNTLLNIDCLSKILSLLEQQIGFRKTKPENSKKKKRSFPEQNSTPKRQFASGSLPTIVLYCVNTSSVLSQDRWRSDAASVHVTRTSGRFVTQNFDNTNDVSLLFCCLPYLLLSSTCLMLFVFLYFVRVLHSPSILSSFFIFCFIYSNWKFNNFDLCYSGVELFSQSPLTCLFYCKAWN
jgi:hypothetical protein